MDGKAGDEIPARCLGETGALNFKKPTEQDLRDTQELESALSQLNIFETTEEMTQRREALIRLQDICNKWIRQKAKEQNLPAHIVSSTTGKVFTFGSYRLGVNFKGADIDSLLVVPRFITRDEFFTEFHTILSDDPNVEDIHAVVDAFVPVLKMVFMGVQIDLLFAQIDQMNISENFNLCENTEVLMRNMDERDVRSINGVRVTEDILNLVYNKNSFKVALKVIRIWAKRRNIYSNALGFLGGVSWAILVSRICQLYPYATPSMLVYLFFKIFSQWPWPKPVRLRESEYIASLGLPVWDPRFNPPDQYHLMPILTPSYPSQNSTYNVQRSNRIIIERELKHALAICEEILLRKLSWITLFDAAFFFRYRHYVIVVVSGSVKRSFIELCGLVEARLRVLVSNFELNRYVKIAHVNCQSYGKGPNDDAELVRKWFIGMEFDRNPNSLSNVAQPNTEKPILNVDLSEHINSFERSIERGLSNDDPSNAVTVKYAKKSQLSQFLSAEDMEEVKRQAVACSSSKTNEQIKTSPHVPSTCEAANSPMNHSVSSSDFADVNSPTSLSRSTSCASMVDVKLNKPSSPACLLEQTEFVPTTLEDAKVKNKTESSNLSATSTTVSTPRSFVQPVNGQADVLPTESILETSKVGQNNQRSTKRIMSSILPESAQDSNGETSTIHAHTDEIKRPRLSTDNAQLISPPSASAR